jgi:hypothetical protein
MRAVFAIVAALALSACASSASKAPSTATAPNLIFDGGRAPPGQLERLIAEAARHPLGSQQNPVRVNMPPGERAYLARLRCSDGAAPQFQRLGNGGAGAFGSIVDIYDVRCAGGEPRQSQIWMDMYHPTHRESAAPPGFTIVPQ